LGIVTEQCLQAYERLVRFRRWLEEDYEESKETDELRHFLDKRWKACDNRLRWGGRDCYTIAGGNAQFEGTIWPNKSKPFSIDFSSLDYGFWRA
jgi:hypothetical protein